MNEHGRRTPLRERPVRRRHPASLLAAVAVGLALVACGGASTATVAPALATATKPAASTPTSTVAPSAAASPAASPAGSAGGSATTVKKVNANTATVAELTAAFEAAGIANASRWAREVEEYRPYPTNDPTFAKLRGELAKYNPGPGVVDQIIAVLTLQ